MKRKQVVALVAGAALGMSAVALGVLLARKEGRDAARRFAEQYGDLGQRGSQVANSIANQAKQLGGQVAKNAADQYKAQLPKAKEALNSAIAQAPQMAGVLAGAFARGSQNGKHELPESTATAEQE
jgi:ABC-type transporter Mla subunit MlaD